MWGRNRREADWPRSQPSKVTRIRIWGFWSRRLVIIVVLVLTFAGFWTGCHSAHAAEGVMDAKRAYGYLLKICDIGPRISGSRGMEVQQKMVAEHFEKCGAKVRFQPFDARHPTTGHPVRMNNVIVSWNPEAPVRVLLGCHYDTRPFADQDRSPDARNGKFIGANDGASGVALFMEMAHHMRALKPTYGVDFVLFDGEELVYAPGDKYFLGSEFLQQDYRDHPPKHRYVYGVVVDMVADLHLNIRQERNSLKYAPGLTKSIWNTARQLKVTEFTLEPGYDIQDDHLPLNDIAHIPTCDIIDFDYPHWHKLTDIPANCSGKSLAKVGKVLLQWLTEIPAAVQK